MKTPVKKPVHPLFAVRAEVAEALIRRDSSVVIPFEYMGDRVRIFFKDGPVGSYAWYEGAGEHMFEFDTLELNGYLRRFDQ
jgi:hypothetical protein